MKFVTSLLILCVCMPYLIHYGNAAGFVPGIPYGGVGSYGSGSGVFGGALLLLFALLFGSGGFGRNDTKIVPQDDNTRLANILIERSTLTGQALETYKTDIRVCLGANKNQARCNGLSNRCAYVPSVGLCVVK